ncbi:hypothetical protein ACFLIM_35785 [Nonomuraea sp. M3C6]|uniref:Uncharacterized protein n=1 Tax=Nonomuraea marmarensis TaxID=3351344 RepID=A0ABW7AME8_9ACTN
MSRPHLTFACGDYDRTRRVPSPFAARDPRVRRVFTDVVLRFMLPWLTGHLMTHRPRMRKPR